MVFIDCSDGFRQAFGVQVFKKTCTLMVCDVLLFRSVQIEKEGLQENQFNVHFDP